MAKTRTILGLAFEDDGLRVAEVRTGGANLRIQHSGVFAWPSEQPLEQASDTGAALRDFLKQNRIHTKTAVVGLPAKWLITKELSMPPASGASLQGMLRLQAERAFALDPQDLALDYVGPVQQGHSAAVLLVGTQRRRLEQILTFLQAAGLEALAVTSTGLCLRRLDREGHQGLYFGTGWIESWSVRSPLPQLRYHDIPGHLSLDNGELKSQIKRLLLLSESPPDEGPQGISLYTQKALDDTAFTDLCRSMNGHAILLNGDSWLEQAGFSGAVLREAGSARIAASLPLTPSRQAGLEVDFLHSAMTQKIKKSHGRAVTWSVIGALVVVILIVMAWMDASSNLKAIASMKTDLADMADDVAAAQAVVDRVTHAARWTSREPEFLQFLRQLTETFPEEGSVWVSNLAIAENRRAVITGQATGARPYLQVLDAIRSHTAFENVDVLYQREAGQGSNDVSFAISFEFKEGK
jgi:hypothetical protein